MSLLGETARVVESPENSSLRTSWSIACFFNKVASALKEVAFTLVFPCSEQCVLIKASQVYSILFDFLGLIRTRE